MKPSQLFLAISLISSLAVTGCSLEMPKTKKPNNEGNTFTVVPPSDSIKLTGIYTDVNNPKFSNSSSSKTITITYSGNKPSCSLIGKGGDDHFGNGITILNQSDKLSKLFGSNNQSSNTITCTVSYAPKSATANLYQKNIKIEVSQPGNEITQQIPLELTSLDASKHFYAIAKAKKDDTYQVRRLNDLDFNNNNTDKGLNFLWEYPTNDSPKYANPSTISTDDTPEYQFGAHGYIGVVVNKNGGGAEIYMYGSDNPSNISNKETVIATANTYYDDSKNTPVIVVLTIKNTNPGSTPYTIHTFELEGKKVQDQVYPITQQLIGNGDATKIKLIANNGVDNNSANRINIILSIKQKFEVKDNPTINRANYYPFIISNHKLSNGPVVTNNTGINGPIQNITTTPEKIYYYDAQHSKIQTWQKNLLFSIDKNTITIYQTTDDTNNPIKTTLFKVNGPKSIMTLDKDGFNKISCNDTSVSDPVKVTNDNYNTPATCYLYTKSTASTGLTSTIAKVTFKGKTATILNSYRISQQSKPPQPILQPQINANTGNIVWNFRSADYPTSYETITNSSKTKPQNLQFYIDSDNDNKETQKSISFNSINQD